VSDTISVGRPPTPVDTEVNARTSPQELIKWLAELTTIGLGASYVLGFLIVNTYLLQFGYSAGSFFKVKYISAGLLYLAIASLLGLCIYPAFWATQQPKHPTQLVRHRRSLLIGTAGCILFLQQLLLLVGGPEILSNYSTDFMWVIGPTFLVLLGLSFIDESKLDWAWVNWLRKYPGLLFLATVSLMLVAVIKWKILLLTFLPLIFVVLILMDFALG